jgi:hypothetical protein
MAVGNKKTIKDFDAVLQASNPLDLMLAEDVLTQSDLDFIKEISKTVSKYRTNSWISDMSLNEMQADLMQLQAMLVDLQHKFGTLTSYAESLKDALKIARSKIRVNAKTLKQQYEDAGDPVSITAEDVEALSYTKTEDIWKDGEKYRIAADFIKFIYFATKDHITMLDHTIHRLARYE